MCHNPSMKSLSMILAALGLFLAVQPTCSALISVGILDKEQAKEHGIVMKYRKNGDAGIMVWLEFKQEGFMKNLSYCDLRMKDEKGNHLLSAKLEERSVVYNQPDAIKSYAFSVQPSHLKNCSFMIVSYGAGRGGVGYYLHVKDFLDLIAIE